MYTPSNKIPRPAQSCSFNISCNRKVYLTLAWTWNWSVGSEDRRRLLLRVNTVNHVSLYVDCMHIVSAISVRNYCVARAMQHNRRALTGPVKPVIGLE